MVLEDLAFCVSVRSERFIGDTSAEAHQRAAARRVQLVCQPPQRRFDVAYQRLPSVVDVDMLHADMLLPTTTPTSEGFNLVSVGLQQPCRGRSQCDNPTFCPMAPAQAGENRHRGGVGAGHLDC